MAENYGTLKNQSSPVRRMSRPTLYMLLEDKFALESLGLRVRNSTPEYQAQPSAWIPT